MYFSLVSTLLRLQAGSLEVFPLQRRTKQFVRIWKNVGLLFDPSGRQAVTVR